MVDAFARYRIVDPLLMYIRSGDVRATSESQLQTILRVGGSKRARQAAIRPRCSGRSARASWKTSQSARTPRARQVSASRSSTFASRRTDLPDGTPLQSAFESMRTARLRKPDRSARKARKQAQIIRAQADADAGKIYAASFGKDPQFYDFYRAMQSYLTTFVGDGQDKPAPTNIVLSPQNDYLKEFSGRTEVNTRAFKWR